MTKNSGRYEEGRQNRQKVLDFLNANPGASAVEVMKACKFSSKSTCATILKKMTCNFEELEREEYKFTGPSGVNYTTFKYWAKVKTTISAREVAQIVGLNLKKGGALEAGFRTKSQGELKPTEPWRYVNDPNSKHPIPRQGGQGALSAGPRFSTYLETNA